MISLMYLPTSNAAVVSLPCGPTWRNTMSLLRRGKVWHYSFCLAGERYRGSTQETSLARARNIEALLIAKAKDRGHSILPRKAPTLSEFSTRFLQWIEKSPLEANS